MFLEVFVVYVFGEYMLNLLQKWLKASFLRGRLPDDDKYKALKHLDQPLQYTFPPVMEDKQLRRFQSSWFWTYSRSENGGYCAYCLAFASSVRTGGNLGALVQFHSVVKFKKALETLASHEKTEYVWETSKYCCST